MLEEQVWKKNLKIILFVRICFSLLFAVSIMTLFWKKYGLDLFDIFLLQAIFAVSVVMFEVPTGYIADKLGRKKTLLLCCLIVSFGWIFYSRSTSFFEFTFSEVVLGIGFSLLSGTDSSLIYESLYELKEEESFSKIEGRQFGFHLWTGAIASLIGGILANFIKINFLILASGIITLFAFFTCFLLTEPHRKPYFHPRGTLYGFYKIVRFVFLKSKIVKFVAPLMAACSLSTMLGVWLYQSLWQEMSIPIWLFGVLWAAILIPAGIASHYADKLENIFGKKLIIYLMPLPAIIGYLLIAFIPGYSALIGIYLVSILRGLTNPILTKHIHKETYSDKRATVLSLTNWLFRISYFILGPLIGWIGKNYGLSLAFIGSAIISIISIAMFIPAVVKRI